MRYLSLFSGVEAATLAWEPLGWEAVAFAEIEPFPSAVLAARWPSVPNLGDITTVDWSDYRGAVDVLVGGSPCQSFSVAGLRKGLADPRGNLALEFLRAVDTVQPRYVVWENVPGVLSANGGRDFGAFLGALGEIGYGFAYRILDAQYFGVPQRRRRLFVVASPGGDWQRPAAVLSLLEGLRGDPAPCRSPGERITGCLEGRTTAGGGGWGTDFLAGGGLTAEGEFSISASGQANAEVVSDGSPALAARQYKDPPIVFKSSHYTRGKDGAPSEVCPPLTKEADRGDQDPLLLTDGPWWDGSDTSECLDCSRLVKQQSMPDKGRFAAVLETPQAKSHSKSGGQIAVLTEDGVADPISASEGRTYTHEGEHNFRLHNVVGEPQAAVRRLTPRECERLQGMPDDHTRIPWRGKAAEDCPDGPRYKAIGNSMAVPVMRWIGERIDMVEQA